MTRKNIISVLERYLHSELTAENVEDWANAVEIRDDIEFGIKNEETVLDAVYILANPVLEGSLPPEMARSLIERLRTEPVVSASED
ncbi:MAG: hypothetical protein KAS59_04090 [Alphaproteobacteria bacterium]|nr:hypothetical protein [Alphaproteobacteria bacterium]